MKRSMLATIGLGGLFLAILSGCDQATLIRKFVPEQDEIIARQYVNDLRQNRLDQIERNLDPGLKDSKMRATLESMAAMFPDQEPVSVKVIGFHTYYRNPRLTQIALEYEFPQKRLLAEVVTQKSGAATTIVGFHIKPIADLENLNRFTLVGKGATQYEVLSLAVLASLVSLYAFVLCIRTRMGKKKWFWLIFIFVGISKLVVNWTTGEVFFTLIAVQLPPAEASNQLYGPWLVYVTLPLGAILFLIMRKRLAASVPQTQLRAFGTAP